MSDFSISFDLRAAMQELAGLKSEMTAIRAEMARVKQAGKDVFTRPQTEAEAIAAEVNKVKAEYEKLRAASATLRTALAGAFDDEAAQKYAEALGDVEATMAEIRQTAEPLGVQLDPPEAAKYSQLAAEIDGLQAKYNEVATAAAKLRAASDNALDPTEVDKYTAALNDAEAEMKQLEQAGRGVGIDLPKGFETSAQKAGTASEVFGELFGQFTKAAVIAGAVQQLSAFAAKSVEVSENYKKTQVVFDKLLQGQGNAEQVIGQVNRSAAANGVLEDTAQQAAKSLLGFGTPLPELQKELSQVANIAAGTGKDFQELTVIYGKARVAGTLYAEDINQLVDAGVPVIDEFAKILNVSTSEVKKLASDGKIGFDTLQTAFTNLTGEGGRFNDLAKEQAKITGDATRAAAEWGKTLRSVGDFLTPLKNAVLGAFSGILGGINNLLNPSQKLSDQYATQLERVQNLDAKLPSLLAKYTDLSGRAKLTETEQNELNATLNALGDIAPGAITAVDKYGNALGINTDKVRAFSDEQRKLLGTIAQLKLEEANKQLGDLNQRVGELQKLASGQTIKVSVPSGGGGGGFGGGFGGGAPRELEITASIEQQTEARKKLLELSEEQLRLTQQKAEAEKVLAQIAEGQAVKAAEPTAEPTKPGTPGATDTGKKATQDELLRAEIERERLRADLLTEGVERDKALENIRFREQIAALRKTFAGRKELRGLEQEATKQHVAALEKIQTDADAADLVKEVEALRAKEEARRQAFENEIAQIEAQAATLEGVEKEKAERIAAAQRQVQEARDTGQSLEVQVRIQERLTRDLQEIEVKAAETRTKQKVEAFQRTQEVELSEFEAAQAQYLASYSTERGATEEGVKKIEEQITKARELFLLSQARAVLEYQLSLGEGLADQQRQQIRAQLEAVNAEIETATANVGKGAKGFNLFSLLGANTDAEKDAIKQAAGEIADAIGQITAAREADAAAAKDAADKNVAAAQQELENQIALANLGFASDVDRAKDKLDVEKTAQNAALENQKRVARQQLAIDTAQQVSSIVSASARIFAEGAKFFPVGIALSLAGIATLFATMASVRSRARAINAGQFRKGGEGYVDGDGIVRGPSHEGGGVKIAEVEGEEFFTSDGQRFAVVNRKMTAKHFNLLAAINDDDRPAMRSALAQLVGLPKMNVQAVGRDITYKTETATGTDGFDAQERRTIINLLKKVEGKKAPEKTTVSRDGATITIKKGNHTRTITNA
jgi:tape measure domain-containing protein